ncbi:hypothetical protein [Chitinophaga agri]|uniref:DUF3592 domain-containing protein n=1 Tax=Chitinophaga agri TaxID=2703787 RepID=A0A6B9ZEU4_9BACT|nr:hypothetical protein [Chitinophaga agri]QHS59063.1 hypothetical protein GWR21_05475 [Chitinophaga agri]
MNRELSAIAAEESANSKKQYLHARRDARILLGITAVLSFIWGYFQRDSLIPAVLLLACMPLSALWLWRHRQSLPVATLRTPRVDWKFSSAEVLVMIVPLWVGAAFGRSIFGTFLDEPQQLVRVAIVMTVVMLLLLGLAFVLSKGKGGRTVALWTAMFYYPVSTCFIQAENKLLDKDATDVVYSTVLEKRYSGGKHPSYDLTLSPWKNQESTVNVSVKQSFYESTSVGRSVNIYRYPGAFHIPWSCVYIPDYK